MKRAITLLCHRRAWSLRLTLEALERCDDVDRWPVLVMADDPSDDVLEVLRETRLGVATYRRSGPPAGREERVSRATFDALALGFARADLVLHLEDDVVLARDALRFVDWAAEEYSADREVFSISTFSEYSPASAAAAWHSARKEPGWLSTGWATWGDRWEEMRAGWGWGDTTWWDHNYHVPRDGRPWDDVVYHDIRRGRAHVFPLVSRSQHVGHEDGSPFTPRVEASAFAGDRTPWHELEVAA